MRWKRAIVWSLERACGLKDRTLGRVLPFPESWRDKGWRWMEYVYGCRLASLSSDLDERWGTEVWHSPK